jgi:hypothetical protein
MCNANMTPSSRTSQYALGNTTSNTSDLVDNQRGWLLTRRGYSATPESVQVSVSWISAPASETWR